MSGDVHEWEAYSPEDDVCDADLGDERRTKRYVSIVEALSHRPDASVPEAVEDESAQEGYYRFVRNPSIAYEDLLEPHYEATRQRAERLDTVLCIHDTTRFAFPLQDDEMRDYLTRLSSNRQGFQWHSSLVFSADRTRAPLELAHTQPLVHLNDLEEDGAPELWDERGGIYPAFLTRLRREAPQTVRGDASNPRRRYRRYRRDVRCENRAVCTPQQEDP